MGYCFWQVSWLIWLFWMFPLTISAASIEKEATSNYVIVCVRTWVLLCHAHRSKDPYNQALKCVHVCCHMSLWMHVCVCLMLSQGCCVKFTQTNNLKSEKQLSWTKCVATGNVAMRSTRVCVYVCICVCVGLRQRACVWSGLLHAWTNMKGRKRAREHAHTHTQTANRKSLLP